MTLRTAQNIFLPKNINAVTNCIENSTVSRGIWDKYRLVIFQISPKYQEPPRRLVIFGKF